MARIRRVITAMSGGVDSSVTALLLKKQGFDVQGVFMKNWDENDETGKCSRANDVEDASWVCHKLDIPFHETNFVKEYWNEVFSTLVSDYSAGLTPNPDILCNKHVKFHTYLKYAINHLEGDAIASGHYARTSYGSFLQHANHKKDVHLLEAKDHRKDQTFFLSQVSQEALRRCMFPVGDLLKHQVRQIAQEHGLVKIAKKKESMGICFIGTRNFQTFISKYISPKRGKFIDISTRDTVGEHTGIHNWTIGQRCKIPGKLKPYFIVKTDPESQDIFVGAGTNHPSLFTNRFVTDKPHWIRPTATFLHNVSLDCSFRFQNTHILCPCNVSFTEKYSLNVTLEKYLRAVTPGQFAVFYKNGECLGSARIVCIGPSLHDQGLTLEEVSVATESQMKQSTCKH